VRRRGRKRSRGRGASYGRGKLDAVAGGPFRFTATVCPFAHFERWTISGEKGLARRRRDRPGAQAMTTSAVVAARRGDRLAAPPQRGGPRGLGHGVRAGRGASSRRWAATHAREPGGQGTKMDRYGPVPHAVRGAGAERRPDRAGRGPSSHPGGGQLRASHVRPREFPRAGRTGRFVRGPPETNPRSFRFLGPLRSLSPGVGGEKKNRHTASELGLSR